VNACVSRREAIACCAAALLAYVGLVHEVVGATLYPDGPGSFGGAAGWHAAGIALVTLGVLAGAGTLGLVRVPVALLGAASCVAGTTVLVGDMLRHGAVHFFALTIVVAGAAIMAARPGQHRP
jgi:hypothetical protein